MLSSLSSWFGSIGRFDVLLHLIIHGTTVEISARQVCLLNVLQKISRDAHSPEQDNPVDLIGFGINADICEQAKREA